MTDSLSKKVGIASLIMMASVFLSRVIGYFRVMVIAYLAGVDNAVDAYQAAFVIPEILNHILASGFLSITFIPIFSGYLAKDREAEGWRVFSIVLTCFGSLLVAFIALSVIFAPALVALTAPGRTDPVWRTQVVQMTRIILPAQFFFFTGGIFMAVQFAKERFLLPALAPLIYNLGIIAGGLCLHSRYGMQGFSWGVLAGAFLGNFAVQYWGARRVGMVFRPIFDFRHPDLRRYILLTLPLMLGLTMTFSTEIFFRVFGSYLPEGSIAVLDYALRIMLMLVAFFGQAVGTASFPFLARLAVEKKQQEMNRLLGRILRLLSLVLPFSALFMVLSREIVAVSFRHGRFDAAAVDLTARVLVCMMAGAVAFTAQTVVTRGFYAVQNTLLPAVFGTIAVFLSIPLYILGVRVMGIMGVALGISLSSLLQVLILFAVWNRYSGNPDRRGVYRVYGKMFLLSVPIGGILFGFRAVLLTVVDATDFTGSLVVAVLTGGVFLVLLVVAGRLFNIREVQAGLDRIRQRTLKRFRKEDDV